jgi:hypothetical protein
MYFFAVDTCRVKELLVPHSPRKQNEKNVPPVTDTHFGLKDCGHDIPVAHLSPTVHHTQQRTTTRNNEQQQQQTTTNNNKNLLPIFRILETFPTAFLPCFPRLSSQPVYFCVD